MLFALLLGKWKPNCIVNVVWCNWWKTAKECFKISITKDISGYFKNLNRGLLAYPFEKLVHSLQIYAIFSLCFLVPIETEFIKLKNQKQVLLELHKEYWKRTNASYFDELCCLCGKRSGKCFEICLSYLHYTFVNNYTKSRNDRTKYLSVLNKRLEKF